MRFDRRALLGAAGVTALLAAGLPALLARRRTPPAGLVRDATGLLDVLPGFEAKVLDRAGDRMSDGFVVPALPDGMGAFPLPDGSLALLRNHELGPGERSRSAHPGADAPAEAFDRESHGAVSRLVLDPRTLEVARSNLVLTGTNRNCAGGWSPWGWLTCEEDVEAGHGWVFVCDPAAERLAPPRRLEAYGRFRHEAAVVDPRTLVAYLTEDREDGCLYRFVPRSAGSPHEGRLDALALEGSSSDTGAMRRGDQARVRWVPLDEVASPRDDLRTRARARGAAVVRRGEGIAMLPGAPHLELYVAATSGGPGGSGQIFRLLPEPEGGELSVVAESVDRDELDMPDNLVVSPRGHVLAAEDGWGPNGVRVLCPSGRIVTLAQSRVGGEIAGLALDPAGEVLFLNLQQEGVTLALRGPFADLA